MRKILIFSSILICVLLTSCDLSFGQGNNRYDISIESCILENIDNEEVSDSKFKLNEEYYLVINLNNENNYKINSISFDNYEFTFMYLEINETNDVIKMRLNMPNEIGTYTHEIKGISYIFNDKIKDLDLNPYMVVTYEVIE